MKVFLDTNVLISAFTTNGVSSKLFDLLNESHEIVISPQVLSEFRKITVQKFGADPIEIDEFLKDVEENSVVCLPPYPKRFDVRDPSDTAILSAAVKSGANYLISGDKDLLSVNTEGSIEIMTPGELLDRLGGGRST